MPEEIDPNQLKERHILVKLLHFKGKNNFHLKGSKSLIKARKSDYNQILTAKLYTSRKSSSMLNTVKEKKM